MSFMQRTRKYQGKLANVSMPIPVTAAGIRGSRFYPSVARAHASNILRTSYIPITPAWIM